MRYHLKTLTSLSLIFCMYSLSAQDPMNETIIKSQLDDRYALKYVINNEFSKIITGSSLGSLGNFAAVSTADNTLKAGINIVKDARIIGINISGGATDGISNIISNSKINSNVNLGINYHRLFMGAEVATDIIPIDEINAKSKSIHQKYETDKITIQNFLITSKKTLADKEKVLKVIKTKIKKREIPNQSRLSSLKKQLLLISKELEILSDKKEFFSKKVNQNALIMKAKNKRDDPNNQDPFKVKVFLAEKLKIESFEYQYETELTAKKKELSTLKAEIESYEPNLEKLNELKAGKLVLDNSIKNLKLKRTHFTDNIYEILTKLANKRDADLKKNWQEIKNIKATDINYSWSSIGVQLSYQSINLFDATRPVENQFYVVNDLVPKFFVSYSGYLNKPLFSSKRSRANNTSNTEDPYMLKSEIPKHIRFYSFGINGTYGNNSSSLELVEIKDSETITPDREIIRSKKAYVGEFVEEELSGQIFGEYYQFVGNKNNVGFHLKSTIDLGPFRPITSVRAGVIVPFTDAKDQKSNLNLEFFFGLNDIFKTTTNNTLLGRNVVGVQATLPLNFKI